MISFAEKHSRKVYRAYSLSDACVSVGKQLEQVPASISAAKRHLSSRIDCVDNNLDQCAELNAATKDEVFKLRGDMQNIGFDVESVQRAVQGLVIFVHCCSFRGLFYLAFLFVLNYYSFLSVGIQNWPHRR